MLINNYTHFKQLNMDMYMFSLPVKEILKCYTVDTFDEIHNQNGYQRPPIATHYKNIADYLIENIDSIFLPSSILGAIDSTDISLIEDNLLKLAKKIRIVDGQHRLKGFQFAIEILKNLGDDNKLDILSNFELPIILMTIDNSKKERLSEIGAFIDINSKVKKVSTDLAITLRDKMYEQSEDYFTDEYKRKEKIATSTAKYLTKKATFSLWYQAIKMTPSDRGTIISVNSFNRSLYPIINPIDNLLTSFAKPGDQIEEEWVDKIVESFPLFISDIWDIIYAKWPGCFGFNREPDKQYNIQKGIGVHALHLILSDCVNEVINIQRQHISNVDNIMNIFSESTSSFRKVLNDSLTTQEDWLSGKKFSGYNSASGFKKVKNYITKGNFDA
ncbi:DGQHR domain-containing protein [Bacillus cereus]|uniref:DGQHR domain-containing protein n=1 Tax=Bacillus cereus TaxID=1396 RepID=UPI0025A2FA0E|nr:DGQHR domain-containing protein [Bacillus cereus]MDM5235320.1 DGQHR domain-containing protein [Bacillus cereus]